MFERGDPRFQQPYYWDHSGDGHAFWWFLMFLLLAVLVGVVAALVFRWLAGRQTAGTVALAPAALGPADDALTVVRMRYARGEIDRDQFLQTSADLGGPPPSAQPPPSEWPQAEPPPDETPTQ